MILYNADRSANEILDDALRATEMPPEDSEFWMGNDAPEEEFESLTIEEIPEDELGDKEVAAMNAELMQWAGDILVKGKVRGEGMGKEIGPAITTMLKPDEEYGFRFDFWRRDE